MSEGVAAAVVGRLAFRLMTLAFVLTTAGILARMWLEGRPPVTNLYSSALFIGWGSVGVPNLVTNHSWTTG